MGTELDPPFSKSLENDAYYTYREEYRRTRKFLSAKKAPVDKDKDRAHTELHCYKTSLSAISEVRRSAAINSFHTEILSRKLTAEDYKFVPIFQYAKYKRRAEKNQLNALKYQTINENRSGTETPELAPPYHVHFGGGKLGLGLILPALVSSGKGFCIVDGAYPEWLNILDIYDVKEKKEVNIKINNEIEIKLHVVGPGEEIPSFLCTYLESEEEEKEGKLEEEENNLILKNPKNNPNIIFILSDNTSKLSKSIIEKDEQKLTYILTHTTSISSSIGPGLKLLSTKMTNIFSRISIQKTKLISFYGCENDHKAVVEFGNTLKNRLQTIPCMVDRICTSKTVEAHGIQVTTEPYEGSIIVMVPDDDKGGEINYLPAFGGPTVCVPDTSLSAHLLAAKKFIMVNGMHTTFAFMTLYLCNGDSDNPGNHKLLTMNDLAEDKKEDIWRWVAARLLLFLWQHELSVMMSAHQANTHDQLIDTLISYAKTTLDRFTSIEDTSQRVLSGGIANRWKTRLKNVDEFLTCTDISLVPLGLALLSKMKIPLYSIKAAVHQLCEDTYRFTSLRKLSMHQRY